MRARMSFFAICLLIVFTTTQTASAFFEDLCLPRRNVQGQLTWCLTYSLERLHKMNKALAEYGDTVRSRSAHPAAFVPFEHMPGNSANPDDTSVCWKPLPTKPAGTM